MATTHHRQSERGQKASLLRSWLRSALLFGDVATDAGGCSDVEVPSDQPDIAAMTRAVAAHDRDLAERGAVLLPFPIQGEALLVRLAGLLRERFSDRGPADEPFLFVISRRPQSRLAVDYRSAVEFDAGRLEFRFEVDVAPNTNIVIRTGDFDALVEFVVQYVAARLAESPFPEAAS